MTRANKALAILMVAAFGLWGCAQGPAHGPAAAEKIKALEGKCSKLEDDYKAVAAARDQLRKKLADAEEQRAKLKQEVEKLLLVAKEAEETKQQLTLRTAERDNLQGQFEQLRKGIRSLLGQAEAATRTPAQPTISTTETLAPSKSY